MVVIRTVTVVRKQTHTHHWWETQRAQRLWRTAWQFLQVSTCYHATEQLLRYTWRRTENTQSYKTCLWIFITMLIVKMETVSALVYHTTGCLSPLEGMKLLH